jgi:metallo-beta-lactamase class B
MKRLMMQWIIAAALMQVCLAAKLDFDDRAQLQRTFDQWNEPVAPFHIAGNIYFVGMRNISSFLISGDTEHVLIDTGFSNSVPLIVSNIVRLGFSPKDIKYILSSHAHADHVAGHAAMKRLTGAKVVVSKADAELLRSGGKSDFLFGKSELMHFEAVEPDIIVRDGERIQLPSIDLTAHLTPGHTPGCTTWTMPMIEKGNRLNVVFFGSTSINPGTRLIQNEEYPKIADDIRASYRKLRGLPCDIFLAPHPEQFGMRDKLAEVGRTENPFIDPRGYTEYLQNAEEAFTKEWERQKAAMK